MYKLETILIKPGQFRCSERKNGCSYRLPFWHGSPHGFVCSPSSLRPPLLKQETAKKALLLVNWRVLANLPPVRLLQVAWEGSSLAGLEC
jgi:hypothetical protein